MTHVQEKQTCTQCRKPIDEPRGYYAQLLVNRDVIPGPVCTTCAAKKLREERR